MSESLLKTRLTLRATRFSPELAEEKTGSPLMVTAIR
jgi:hypothetical protein